MHPAHGFRGQGEPGSRGYNPAMANLITLSRLLLLIVVVVIAYQPEHPWWQLANVPLLIFLFVTDGLDGYVARKRGEASVFGAMFDIAGDRIVECLDECPGAVLFGGRAGEARRREKNKVGGRQPK